MVTVGGWLVSKYFKDTFFLNTPFNICNKVVVSKIFAEIVIIFPPTIGKLSIVVVVVVVSKIF